MARYANFFSRVEIDSSKKYAQSITNTATQNRRIGETQWLYEGENGINYVEIVVASDVPSSGSDSTVVAFGNDIGFVVGSRWQEEHPF